MTSHPLGSSALAALAIAAILFSSACSGPQPVAAKATTEDQLPNVAVTRVVRQDLAQELDLAAEFRPNEEVDVYSKLSAYLKTIHVDVGDRVRRGQTIAILELPEMSNDLAQATAALKRSELEVQRARGDVQRMAATVRVRQLAFDRLSGVVKERPNLVAQQEIDDAAAALQDAEAQMITARATLAAAEEQVRAMAASRERIHTMMGYLNITAPFTGVVTKRFADPGAMIQAGTASQTQAMPLVRLSAIDHVRLILPVPESVVPRIKVGAPVEVRVDSLARVFHGRISRFTRNLDSATRTMATEVDLPNSDYVLMPGMYGKANLKLERREDTIAVPVQAVLDAGTSPAVLIAADNVLAKRPVVLGIETPDMVEIVSGVAEGELVVLGARASMKDGQHVRPTLVDAPAAPRSH